MKIYASVHPESSEEAFEMLNTFGREARDRGVEVVIMKSVP
jgi:hypothetical protein